MAPRLGISAVNLIIDNVILQIKSIGSNCESKPLSYQLHRVHKIS